MKNITLILCAVALAAPVWASASEVSEAKTGQGKDMCFLNSENCPGQSYSIQEIITRLRIEINKGNSTYTTDEIRKLQSKLKRYQKLLASLKQGAADTEF